MEILLPNTELFSFLIIPEILANGATTRRVPRRLADIICPVKTSIDASSGRAGIGKPPGERQALRAAFSYVVFNRKQRDFGI